MADRFKVTRVANTVIYTRQVNAKIVTAINNDRIVHVLHDHHVFASAAVHTTQAHNFEYWTIINKVGPWAFAVFVTFWSLQNTIYRSGCVVNRTFLSTHSSPTRAFS